MKKNIPLIVAFLPALLCYLFFSTAKAQFTLTGEFRARAELRDGQGTLLPKDAVPAFFISQRTRLNIGYTGYRFKFFTSLQDVRTWGQDRSTINSTTTAPNNGFQLHEAWGEISLLDTTSKIEALSVKMGRQELIYDDERLLGGLNWLQQARHHDAAVLKFANKGWKLDLGFAFNQNSEYRNQPKSGQTYSPVPDQTYLGTNTIYPAGTNGIGEMYKTMEFFYVSKKFSFGSPSFLFFKDDFSKYHYALNDSAKTTPVYDRETWGRMTTGFFFPVKFYKNFSATGSAYYQFGQDKTGNMISAYLLSLSTSIVVNNQFSFGPGMDYTSGNGAAHGNPINHQFDPLYGTPHKFWANMDYFYAADLFSANGAKNGLIDYYLKTKYKSSDKFILNTDIHQFFLSNQVSDNTGNRLDRNMGTEIDIVGVYNLTKNINIEAGYSSMFATPVMASVKVKNVNNASLQANWAYLMVTIKPDFMAKK